MIFIGALRGRISNLSEKIKDKANKIARDAMVILKNCLSSHSEKDLVVLDDMFPHPLSAFRIAEYNCYLKHFGNVDVHSTAATFTLIGEARGFSEICSRYEREFPQFAGHVIRFNRRRVLRAKLVYTMFLNNAFFFIDYIEKENIPFVFTLYPGGGFQLNQEDSDRKLRRVLSSPLLRKVIVTQTISYRYLVDNQFCLSDKVEHIYGVVLPTDRLTMHRFPKSYYKKHKDTFDLCFVAHKYTRDGADKGYDVFLDVASLLSKIYPDIVFHVVGPFDASVLDVSELQGRIRFYGSLETGFFPEFYAGMDMILSPNIPFVLAPGAFDGFPTGCCVEAGLCGVAVMCTDPLGQNSKFKDREEILLVPHDSIEIFKVIDNYYNRYEDLCCLAERGREAFTRVFDMDAQMDPRRRVLTECMNTGALNR
ncbi:MAG: glycosyltransferase family 4 protein [Gemmatimonadaceae bacterium]|nr:glycosyltransferase family 4 protein [Chitinophagaceae bacterium]